MIQTLDGVEFRMKTGFDFSFLRKYGKIFKVFDSQDSGNICFGIEGSRRLFVKFAGAPTAEYSGKPEDAVQRLKATLPVYKSIRHDCLIHLIDAEEIGNGFAMIFEWFDGRCMGRMYPDDHRHIMSLPLSEKESIFDSTVSFLTEVHRSGYVAVDFYDGSVLYNDATHETIICDIDFFQRMPCINRMGRMWGSSRFMAPEEYELGAPIDERTNVFTAARMAFSLFTDSRYEKEDWPLSEKSYEVLMKATDPERKMRYSDLNAFYNAWKTALC